MKLINYKLQSEIERLNENKPTQNFKEYIKGILENNSTSYFQKCDYLGLSLDEIKNKIDILSQDIQELQTLKRNLTQALEIAKEIAAEVFLENGIDRIDGNIISSLTLIKENVKTKDEIKIKDEAALMSLGYVKFSLDMEAIEEGLKDGRRDEIKDFAEISIVTTVCPAKIKVNKKRDVKPDNINMFPVYDELPKAF